MRVCARQRQMGPVLLVLRLSRCLDVQLVLSEVGRTSAGGGRSHPLSVCEDPSSQFAYK